MKTTCAVTGASGYLGSKLADHLKSNGFDVIPVTRHPQSARGIAFSFEAGVAEGAFRDAGIDALIHAAWDFTFTKEKEIFEANVQGSIELFRRADAEGVDKLVFISTMSAYEGCKSLYGKAKLAVEREVSRLGGTIIRPGLIYGDEPRGMVGALTAAAKLSPILPMIGSGKYVLYLIHESDLAALITHFVLPNSQAARRPVIAASPEGHKFREIIKAFADLKGRKVTLIPLPWRLFWIGLKMTEALSIKLPFRSDSVISLVNQCPDPDFSETAASEIPLLAFSSFVSHS